MDVMKKFARFLIAVCLLCTFVYGAGRLYFFVTDGFTVDNISSDLAYDPRLKLRPLSFNEQKEVETALSQEYHYFGKGCQSYVFLSKDKNYVIKFVKFQRFRPQSWMNALAIFPPMESYRQMKIAKRKKRLDYLLGGWVLAYNELSTECGLVYLHLNKTSDMQKQLLIYDKIGFKHLLNLNEMEFLIQKKATMLKETIDGLVAKGESEEVKLLIQRILKIVESEYVRGIADNDHALMQNTGVVDGRPIHLDLGQFVYRDDVKTSPVFKQEFFSKMYRFREWLRDNHPEIGDYLEERMVMIIGPQYYEMKPFFKKHNCTDLGEAHVF